MKIFLLVLKIWFAILPVAFINGTIRVFLINPSMGEKVGHIVSTLMLSIAALFIIYFFLKKARENYLTRELLIIGLLLTIMTILFEFGLGRVTGKSWEFLFADYDILKGRIWSLVLLTELISPLLVAKVSKINSNSTFKTPTY